MQSTKTIDLAQPAHLPAVAWLGRGVLLLVGALAAPAVIHLTGTRTWPLELAHHFAPHYAAAGALFAGMAWALRRPRPAILAGLLALYFAAVYWTAPSAEPAAYTAAAATGDPGSHSDEQHFDLITNNVFMENSREDALVAWLSSRPADVIVLQEVFPTLAQRLRAGEADYPHRVVAEQAYVGPDATRSMEAIAVLSRYPIIEHRSLPPWRAWQAMLVRLDVQGVRPWIAVIHPPSPAFRKFLPVRDRFYQELAPVLTGLNGPIIVAGDFNATPYTPVFRTFAESAGLHTFQRFPATYPDWLGPFGIPIDHVLVRGAKLAGLRAITPVGSDHRPLHAAIIVPSTPHADDRR